MHVCSGVPDEDVQMPEMVEPQKVLVMLPRDHSQSQPSAVTPRATNSAGVVPSYAPGGCHF